MAIQILNRKKANWSIQDIAGSVESVNRCPGGDAKKIEDAGQNHGDNDVSTTRGDDYDD